jgi:hypothetical protein
MDTDRRKVLAGATLLTTFAALGASGAAGAKEEGAKLAPTPESARQCTPGLLEVIRVTTGPDGKSRYERVSVLGSPAALPVAEVRMGCISQGVEDWHPAPRKLFTINVKGDIRGDFGDGTSVPIGKGDLVFLEDTTGKGHITNLLSEVSNIFIVVEPDFDFDKWAKGA